MTLRISISITDLIGKLSMDELDIDTTCLSEHDNRSVNKRKFYNKICAMKYKVLLLCFTFFIAIMSLISLTLLELAVEKYMETITSVMHEILKTNNTNNNNNNIE